MFLIFLSYFLVIASVACPPLFLITVPLSIIATQVFTRRVREARQMVHDTEQIMARRAYMAELRRRAGGEV